MAKRLTEQEKILRAISEASFQRTVEAVLTRFGWLYFHAPDNKPNRHGFIQNIKAGFPDLVAVRGNRVVYMELKREQGVVSDAQAEWHEALQQAGQEIYVFRPSDLEHVTAILSPSWLSEPIDVES